MATATQFFEYWGLNFVSLAVAVVLLDLFFGMVGYDLVLKCFWKEAVIVVIASAVQAAGFWFSASLFPGDPFRRLLIPQVIVGIIYWLAHHEDWSGYEVCGIFFFQGALLVTGLCLFGGQFTFAVIVFCAFALGLAIIASIAKSLWGSNMRITEGGLDDPLVQALLAHHFKTARAETAPGSAHALDLSGLKAPDISFWTAWDGDSVIAIGALKRLSNSHGEIKSMHTSESHRRKGAGSAMLQHIVATARQMGLSRLSLETGSWPYFNAARDFYRRHGFIECAPFGSYVPDPNSVFMTLDITASGPPPKGAA